MMGSEPLATEEREALELLAMAWDDTDGEDGSLADDVVEFVRAALAAVPRLATGEREVGDWERTSSADHVVVFERETPDVHHRLVWHRHDNEVSIKEVLMEDGSGGFVSDLNLDHLLAVLGSLRTPAPSSGAGTEGERG